MDASYHRHSQLDDSAEVGVGAVQATRGGTVIVFGGQNTNVGPKINAMLAHPSPGMVSAPVDWLANENLNPVPDLRGQRVGYPISIYSMTETLAVSSFTLADERGSPVTARLLTTRTDNNQSLREFAFIVPLAPLAAGAKYTARAAGTANGAPFDVCWQFTTTPATPRCWHPRRPRSLDPQVRV